MAFVESFGAGLLGLGYSQTRQTGLAARRFCAADMGEGGLGGVEGDEDFLGRGELAGPAAFRA